MSEHSQGENEQKLTFLNRLDRLRGKTRATWADIGKMMGLSRTMLHHLRKGEHEPSQRTLALLERAEIDAGLREADAGLREASSGRRGIQRLIESNAFADLNIQPRDHDAGMVQVKVEFRRGSTPAGFEGTVPVKALPAGMAANLLVDLLHDQDVEEYLRQCLPPPYASEDFLNRLEPTSFLRLLHATLEMSLGKNWKDRLRNIPHKPTG
jgi:hypothetical protein